MLTHRDGWNEDEHRIPTARHDAPPSRVAEARFLAQRLRELADGGVDPAGMVVLLRAFTNVDVYAEALELAGLDPHVVGGRGYWSAQQVADALACSPASPTRSTTSRCSARSPRPPARRAPTRSGSCAGSPGAGATSGRRSWSSSLAATSRTSAPEGAEDEPDEAEIERRARRATLGGADPRRPTPSASRRFYERLTRPARARGRAAAARHARRADARDVRLRPDHAAGRRGPARGPRTCASSSGSRPSTRRTTAATCAASSTTPPRAPRSPTARRRRRRPTEEHSGVRVMTIHAAKGLEFETVAVADLGRKLCTRRTAPRAPARLRSRGDRRRRRRGTAAGARRPAARARGRRLDRHRGLQEPQRRRRRRRGGGVGPARLRRREPRRAAADPQRRLRRQGPRGLREAAAPALGARPACCRRSGVDGEDGAGRDASRRRSRARASRRASSAARVAVRVIGAGAESAARLSRDMRGPRETRRARARGQPRPCRRSPREARRRRAASPTRRSPTTGAAATGSWSSGSSASAETRRRLDPGAAPTARPMTAPTCAARPNGLRPGGARAARMVRAQRLGDAPRRA